MTGFRFYPVYQPQFRDEELEGKELQAKVTARYQIAIPALDGCKLLFLAWEGLTGHPVPLRAQGFIHTAGMVALLWLMILVTMQDITRFL